MKLNDVALGSIYAMASRLIMLVSGFVIQIVLARKLGPELFGIYTLIISILLWTEYSVSMGIPSVFQKIISETRHKIRALIGAVGKYSVPYCLAIMLLFALISPLIAVLMSDSRLRPLLLIASLDIPVFGLYMTFICMLNGHGEFLTQSTLAATYSVIRTMAIVAAVILGFGVAGALVGNAIGSMFGALFAFYFTQKVSLQYASPINGIDSEKMEDIKPRLISFGIPYTAYHLFNSMLIHMDIWFVQILLGSSGLPAASLGFYAVAYNLARIPHFIISGISFTVFPAISKAVFEDRMHDAQQLIKQMLRMVFIILFPLNALVLSTAEQMITLLFSATYAPAADTLRILFVGISLYTIFLFLVNIIAAQNRPVTSFLMSIALIPVAITLHVLLISKFGIIGAAAATTLISAIGIVIVCPFIFKQFDRFVDFVSLFKVSIASTVVYFVSTVDVLYQAHLIIGYCLLGTLYIAILFLVREIDLEMIRGVFPPRKRLSNVDKR